ncbi:hypothetical protein D3C75_1361630 [compost metagenome]
MADTAGDLYRILFNLHPQAASVAFLPAGQLMINFLGQYTQIAGQTFNNSGQLGTVGFACC